MKGVGGLQQEIVDHHKISSLKLVASNRFQEHYNPYILKNERSDSLIESHAIVKLRLNTFYRIVGEKEEEEEGRGGGGKK